MDGIRAVTLALLLIGPAIGFAGDKSTSLAEARTAVEANLRTPEGKKYDEQMGTDFMQKHLGSLRQCKQSAGTDTRSFWILLKLDKDGAVQELLLSPETMIGDCAREALLKDKLLPPPRPAYWVGIFMKITR